MAETTFIYGLVDPRTNELRYVGKANDPKRRLCLHIGYHKTERNHKASWIKSLITLGKHPSMIVLEEISINEWMEAERWWIEYAKSLGCRLTNLTLGATGLPIPVRNRIRSESRNGKKLTASELQSKEPNGKKIIPNG